jgi:hypothetical protein
MDLLFDLNVKEAMQLWKYKTQRSFRDNVLVHLTEGYHYIGKHKSRRYSRDRLIEFQQFGNDPIAMARILTKWQSAIPSKGGRKNDRSSAIGVNDRAAIPDAGLSGAGQESVA